MNGETRPGVSAGSKSVGAIVKCTAEVSSPSGAALASAAVARVRASTHSMRRRVCRLIGIVSFLDMHIRVPQEQAFDRVASGFSWPHPAPGCGVRPDPELPG